MNNFDQHGSTEPSADLKSELKDDGRRLAETAKQEAAAMADQGKGKATSVANATASALSEAANYLRQSDDAPQWLASAFEQTVQSVTSLASKVDNKEPQQMAGEISQFAKKSPTAFLAMSAAAGFAASRFFKAGAEQRGDLSGHMTVTDRDVNHSISETPEFGGHVK